MRKLISKALFTCLLMVMPGLGHAETTPGLFLLSLNNEEVIVNGAIKTLETQNGFAFHIRGVSINAKDTLKETFENTEMTRALRTELSKKFSCADVRILDRKELGNSPMQASVPEKQSLLAFEMKIEQNSEPTIYSATSGGSKSCFAFVEPSSLERRK